MMCARSGQSESQYNGAHVHLIVCLQVVMSPHDTQHALVSNEGPVLHVPQDCALRQSTKGQEQVCAARPPGGKHARSYIHSRVRRAADITTQGKSQTTRSGIACQIAWTDNHGNDACGGNVQQRFVPAQETRRGLWLRLGRAPTFRFRRAVMWTDDLIA